MIGVACKIQIQNGISPNDKIWVSGYIRQLISDGRIVVRVPDFDQIFYCYSYEVFINMEDIQSSIMDFLGVNKK